MRDDIAGRGDPVRTLQLLWGGAQPPKRGPKPKASLADIVGAAVALADAEGLEAVSTRRVAEAVGISPMSFYTHVPGKAELLDLMLDAVTAAVRPRPLFDPAEWRTNVRRIAEGYRQFYLRHPWVFELATHRPVFGPNTILAYDIGLSAFDQLGLDEVEMDMSLTLVANYVHGAVRDAARSVMVKKLTGMSDDEWWLRIEPHIATLDYSEYPVVQRVGPVVGELYGLGDPDRAFAFGLERLLDGMAQLIASKRKVDGKPASA